jgi:probable F420-dependent oxidoreductase
MKYGAIFPQTEYPSDPIAIRDYAQAVEAMGYDYLLVYDHILGANPDRPGGWTGAYTFRESFQEPFVLFGYLAGLTQRLELVTGILILPQRETALVAKQAAEVDVLSGGRLRLGVGLGWNEVEYQAMGFDFHTRGRRIGEQVELLRQLWTEPLVKFQSEDHFINDAGVNPLPVQRPIPIWFGGEADPVLKRTAKLGDGWIPNSMMLDKAEGLVAKMRGYLEAEGRDPDNFGIDMRINARVTPPDQWGSFVDGWKTLGATHGGFNTMGMGFTAPDQHLDLLRQFKETVGQD